MNVAIDSIQERMKKRLKAGDLPPDDVNPSVLSRKPEAEGSTVDELTNWLQTAHAELVDIQMKAVTTAAKAKRREYEERILKLNQVALEVCC